MRIICAARGCIERHERLTKQPLGLFVPVGFALARSSQVAMQLVELLTFSSLPAAKPQRIKKTKVVGSRDRETLCGGGGEIDQTAFGAVCPGGLRASALVASCDATCRTLDVLFSPRREAAEN
jgi:hypothetical protein